MGGCQGHCDPALDSYPKPPQLSVAMERNPERQPTGFTSPPRKHWRKWEQIVSAFFAGDMETLLAIQRTGTRGRILAILVRRCFDVLSIGYQSEPIFAHVSPAAWYAEFAARHELKLVTHDHYNPDFLLNDGTWAEVTLSENTAFRKLFRYGHQAPRLLVLWLDADEGLHKQVCQGVEFPNATVRSADWYYPQLEQTADGRDVVEKVESLRGLRHKML